MTNKIAASFVDGIAWTHQAILWLVQDLSDEMLTKPPSTTAPLISWHVFHIARWADRLQVSLPSRLPADSHPSDLPDQIWRFEEVAQA
ncbi:MAG: DinB family protein [Anaerolineales bacterium]|nr:DinB family protein [Anaerolineales bacterium]